MELEVFVHGALCIAYSGRCLLSGYMNHRDPNQGACTNACRWKYDAHLAKDTETGDIVPVNKAVAEAQIWTPDTFSPELASKVQGNMEGSHRDDTPIFLLEEQNRPGELMPAYEDEHGTYIMNSKDLRAVQHIPKLVDMGIHSLKIEGRTKSHYYVARTAQVYRKAIDDAVAGQAFNMELMAQLDHLANRGYTEGFYRRHVPQDYQNYERGVSSNSNQQFVGEIKELDTDRGWALVEVKNRFETGDTMELISPAGNRTFAVEAIENKDGIAVAAAPGSGHFVRIPLPETADLGEGQFAMLMRHMG
jgi:putative protease